MPVRCSLVDLVWFRLQIYECFQEQSGFKWLDFRPNQFEIISGEPSSSQLQRGVFKMLTVRRTFDQSIGHKLREIVPLFPVWKPWLSQMLASPGILGTSLPCFTDVTLKQRSCPNEEPLCHMRILIV